MLSFPTLPLPTVRAGIKNIYVASKIDNLSAESSTRTPIADWNLENKEDAATILKAGPSKNTRWPYIYDKLFAVESEHSKDDFFNTDKVQRKLIKGVIEGTLDEDEIITALKSCLPNLDDKDRIVQSKLDAMVRLLHNQPSMSFIFRFFHGLNKEAQNNLAGALLAGKFGKDSTVLQAIIANIGMFTDPEARLGVAKAIRKGQFGNDSRVLKALVQQFDCLGNGGIYDKDVQKELALAISEGKFGTHPDVLIEIANHFGIFSSPVAQKTVAGAINSLKFGADIEVLKVVAKQLNCFTTTEARFEVGIALLHDAFGTDAEVLKEVASHLGMFAVALNPNNFANSHGVITDEMHKSLAQSVAEDLRKQFVTLTRLADAIHRAKFGADVLVQREVAAHLDIFKSIEGDVESIVFAKFDAAVSVSPSFRGAVKHLRIAVEAEKINKQLQKGIEQQLFLTQNKIATAFSVNTFIADPDVQKNVAKNLTLFTTRPGLVMSALQEAKRNDTQRKLVEFVVGGYFDDSQAKLDAQEFLARYIEQGQLSPVVVAEKITLEAAVANFCATRDLTSATVESLQHAVADGKFNDIDANLKIRLANHLKSFLPTAAAIADVANDPAATKKLAIQFSKDAAKLSLSLVREFLAQSINQITFDTSNLDEKVALEAIVRKFSEPGNISPSMSTPLQQAWHNKKFATIDPALKAQLQAKLNIWSTPAKVVGALTVLGVLSVAGFYSYSYFYGSDGSPQKI